MIRRYLSLGVIIISLLLVAGWDIRSTLGPTLAWGAQKPRLTISMIEHEQTHTLAGEVLKKAYHKIGYQVDFAELPAKRAIIWANEGRTDGDVARIRDAANEYPNLVQVSTPVVHFKGVAFSRGIGAEIKSWEDLKPYRVGVIRGIRYSARGTKGLQPLLAGSMTQLFMLLDTGRIQVAIAAKESGMLEIQRNFRGKGFRIVGSPLYEAPLFHFLNKKWKDIVPRLDGALKEMKKSGEMQAIHDDAMQKLLD